MWLIDLYNLKFIHRDMINLMMDRAIEFPDYIGRITSLYRIPDGPPSSVHEVIPLRGIDEGCHILSLGNEIERKMNDRWIYDPTRLDKKVCIFHDTGQGLHLHYQVHDSRTIRRR